MDSQKAASAAVGLTAGVLIKVVLGVPLWGALLVGAAGVLLTQKAIDKYASA